MDKPNCDSELANRRPSAESFSDEFHSSDLTPIEGVEPLAEAALA
ncbi:hypothetical protein [Tropicibacter alexandrii]|nr:hypothetical protein [Tropicibacter alexandrii]